MQAQAQFQFDSQLRIRLTRRGSFPLVLIMVSKKNFRLSIQQGVPTDIRTDLASYFTGRDTDFMREVRRLRIKVTYAEKGRHNQNHAAEREIRD
jgi:hypothetical protein